MTYHVILLVIISNNIPLSLSITLIYYFVPNGLFIWYISPLSYRNFEFLFTNILFVKTQPFLFGSPNKALQLTKAYRVEPA